MKCDYANGERIESSHLHRDHQSLHPTVRVEHMVRRSGTIETTTCVGLSFDTATLGGLYTVKAHLELWPADATKLARLLIYAATYDQAVPARPARCGARNEKEKLAHIEAVMAQLWQDLMPVPRQAEPEQMP